LPIRAHNLGNKVAESPETLDRPPLLWPSFQVPLDAFEGIETKPKVLPSRPRRNEKDALRNAPLHYKITS